MPRIWQLGNLPGCVAKVSPNSSFVAPGSALWVCAFEGRRHFGHEARHLVLDLIVRFQADIEVDDDLGESDRLIIPAPGKSRAAIGP